ncbi:hypothetical protein HK102_010088, partial [Quaeritorhiza haematococci]
MPTFHQHSRTSTVTAPLAAHPINPRLSTIRQSRYEKPEQDADPTINKILSTFPTLPRHRRHAFILALLHACDPSDMTFIFTTLPRLHRDFIRLLPPILTHRILAYIHPLEYPKLAGVSKSWSSVLGDQDLWFTLYRRIGLLSLVERFYLGDATVAVNARRLYSLKNWVHGNFRHKVVDGVHTLGILAVCLYPDHRNALSFGNAGGAGGSGNSAANIISNVRMLASASLDNTAKVFNLNNGECIRTFIGHEGAVQCLQMDEHK